MIRGAAAALAGAVLLVSCSISREPAAAPSNTASPPEPTTPELPPPSTEPSGSRSFVRPDVPYVAANPGYPVKCAQLPFPGIVMSDYATHDCWAVRRNDWGDVDAFYLGGRDPDDHRTGVLFATRVGTSDEDTGRFVLPGRHGDLTITFARWTHVCVRSADGSRAVFVMASKKFRQYPAAGFACR